MSFTTEELKRMKSEAWEQRDGKRHMWIEGPKISALIARLEAAEAMSAWGEHSEDCPRYRVEHGDPSAENGCDCGLDLADMVWREACGRA